MSTCPRCGKKAQGATEYLVVLAIVFLVVIIGITIFSGISSPDRALADSSSYWGAQTPFAISEAGVANGKLSLAVKNFDARELKITRIDLKRDGVVATYVPPESDATFYFSEAKKLGSDITVECEGGKLVQYEVTIRYSNTRGIPMGIEEGEKQLSFTCPSGGGSGGEAPRACVTAWGDNCEKDSDCCSGICGGEYCVPADMGGTCGTDADCPDMGFCLNGICSQSQLGGECHNNLNCLEGYCNGANCVQKNDNGANCGSDVECASGYCVEGICSAASCRGGGESCNLDKTCCVGYCMLDHTCGYNKCTKDGQACTTSLQCCRGNCNEGVCACMPNGQPTFDKTDCCSQTLVNGYCTCMPDGEFLSLQNPQGCCSGTETPGGYCGCVPSGLIFAYNPTECCSGNANGMACQ